MQRRGGRNERRRQDPDRPRTDRAATGPDPRDKDARLLAPLDEREREILKLRFGLDRGEPRTLEEVGEHFNLGTPPTGYPFGDVVLDVDGVTVCDSTGNQRRRGTSAWR